MMARFLVAACCVTSPLAAQAADTLWLEAERSTCYNGKVQCLSPTRVGWLSDNSPPRFPLLMRWGGPLEIADVRVHLTSEGAVDSVTFRAPVLGPWSNAIQTAVRQWRFVVPTELVASQRRHSVRVVFTPIDVGCGYRNRPPATEVHRVGSALMVSLVECAEDQPWRLH